MGVKNSPRMWALLALLMSAITVVGVMKMGDNPDWTLPVSVRAQEIENLSVDIKAQSLDHLDIWLTGQTQDMNVNVTNSSLDVNVTNSAINVNVTNTTLNVDANITNSTLNVTVQGTANVNIQNAELNVKNLREQASESGNVTYASVELDLKNYYGQEKTLYTNNGTAPVYLEMLTARYTGGYSERVDFQIRLRDSAGTVHAEFYAVLMQFPLNFDPAIPIPPGWYITVYAERQSTDTAYIDVSAIIRTA